MLNILIEANKISKVYDADLYLKRGSNFYALSSVDFILEEGDFISVMGPSGSGKSTLLNILSTLDKATSGQLKILDKDVTQMKDDELCAFRYEYLGFIFQNHNLVSTLSIFDNIATPLILARCDKKEISNRVVDLASKLNIDHILNKKPQECSGGERQRAAIARAIVNNPKIVICDEPTGNLDSKNSHEVLSILSQLNKEGTSIILVTHDNMIASYANRFMYLRDGRIQTVINRKHVSQKSFFDEIVKVTTQDSLLSIFNDPSANETQELEDTKESPIGLEHLEVSENHHEEKRLLGYAIFDGVEPDAIYTKLERNIFFHNQTITYKNMYGEDIVIPQHSIEQVVLSLHPFFKITGIFSEYHYYLTLDITCKNHIYKLELVNERNIHLALSWFNDVHIKVIDQIGIQEIYQKYPDTLQRLRYLQRNFKKIAKSFNIPY